MNDFLSPLSKNLVAHTELLSGQALGRQLMLHTETDGLPDWESCRLALVGISEARRHSSYLGELPQFDDIRQAFYALYPGNWQHSMADLGDIEPGETVEDTYFAVKTVVAQLLEKNVIPIIIGGSQDLLYAVYRAYDTYKKMVNIVNIDSRFDLGDADATIHHRSYVGKIVVDTPYNLFNYSVLGYQGYYNSVSELSLLEKLYFEAYRLGEITTDISLVEPVTRDADIVSLDIHAIKNADLCYKDNASPNGLDGREVCAIARYAGLSNKVSSFGLFEMIHKDQGEATGLLLAQVLWYFVEGVNFRMDDGDFSHGDDFATYQVPIDEQVLVFKKSLLTERWWVALPFSEEVDTKIKSPALLPCTRQDYERACRQELPERWLKARRKNEL